MSESSYYRDAETYTLQNVPTSDRMKIVATIVGVKRVESRFGSQGNSRLMMTILCEGDTGRFKLWGTCPMPIQDAITEARRRGDPKASVNGSLIEFYAQTERSDRDPKFGFFKRPARAKVLVTGRNGGERA